MQDVMLPEFQTELVRALLQDSALLKTCRKHLTDKLFRAEDERVVMRALFRYFDKYGTLPSRTAMMQVLASDDASGGDAAEVLSSFYDEKVRDVSFVRDSLRDFVRKQKYRDMLVRGMEHLKKGDFDGIYKDVQKLVNEFVAGSEIGEFFFDRVKDVIAAEGHEGSFIPTGFFELDEKLSGGPIRGTQSVILTPPNRGKTTTLVNIGKNALLSGFRVAHLTTELSERITHRRYIMSMTGMSKHDIRTKRKTAFDRVLDIAEKVARENLIVRRFLPGACTVKDVHAWICHIRDELGFIPDVLIVDMPSYLRSTRKLEEKRHELSDIYTELRALAIEFDLVQWTAHQTNRSAGQEGVISTRDLAEDFGIAGITDIIISVNQSLEQKRDGVADLFLAKARDDESQIRIPVSVDWTCALMKNAEA